MKAWWVGLEDGGCSRFPENVVSLHSTEILNHHLILLPKPVLGSR